MRDGLSEALTAAGARQIPGVLPTSVEKTDAGLRVKLSNSETLMADQILVATGRAPHTVGLGLEKAGVATEWNGAIRVDDESRTMSPSDLDGSATSPVGSNLTPVAIREGHLLADGCSAAACSASILTSSPPPSSPRRKSDAVGLTEVLAREKHPVVDVYQTSFSPMKATTSGSAERTRMKIVVDGDSDACSACTFSARTPAKWYRLWQFPCAWARPKPIST